MADTNKIIVDRGFVPEPTVPDDHYVLGGYGEENLAGVEKVLMPGGHGWRKYKPKKELQKQYGFESMNCTSYGTLNPLETLAAFHKLDDFPKDCSERYLGVLAGTTPEGNSPHKVIETIRTFAGVLEQAILPWTSDITDWNRYYSPNPMDEGMIAHAQKILRKYRIRHAWVFNGLTEKGKQGKLISALEIGTVAVSVRAWSLKNGRYWKDKNATDNHWVQLLDFKQGDYWLVYDQYEDTEKKLEWDYNFGSAKVYFIEMNTDPASWKPFSESTSVFWLLFSGIKKQLSAIRNFLWTTSSK